MNTDLSQPTLPKNGAEPFYLVANPLLLFLLLFSFLLLAYSCFYSYTYLPTIDTWAHINFLGHAAQGHLDWAELFQKHNHVHRLVIPKLIYFFDITLTHGSGIITMLSALILLFGTAVLVYSMVKSLKLPHDKKLFLTLSTFLLLCSPAQAESLFNPANVQWACLNFFAVLSAYGFYQFITHNKRIGLLWLCCGITGVALSSASVLLIIIPLIIFAVNHKYPKSTLSVKALLIFIGLLIGFLLLDILRVWLMPNSSALILHAMQYLNILPVDSPEFNQAKNLINAQPFLSFGFLFFQIYQFITNFLSPVWERFNLTGITTAWVIFCVFAYCRCLSQQSLQKKHNETKDYSGLVFFNLLIFFCIFSGLCIAFVRSLDASAYTFRFANLGLLFTAVLFISIFVQSFSLPRLHIIFRSAMVIYLLSLSLINTSESMAFGFGRNHLKLSQIAYALNIHDSFVIAAMPGTPMEKPAYEFIENNKAILHNNTLGIYHSEPYGHLGKSISSLPLQPFSQCHTHITKKRRLNIEQAAYKIKGYTETVNGNAINQVYFTDMQGIIHGFAIAQMPGKTLWNNILEDHPWAGFVNLDHTQANSQRIKLYAYNTQGICPAETLHLPAYKKPQKKRLKKAL